MGCVISCGLKLILQVLNTILCVAFVAVAVFGILLKCSKSMVQNLLTKIFQKYNIGDKDIRQMAQFLTENADGIAIVLIVVGLALAVLCLIGCVASCCGCNILLKIYAAILIVLLVVQIIAVAVAFSDPARTSSMIVKALRNLLESYYEDNSEGGISSAVWNVIMSSDPICCGMEGYSDFGVKPPPPCCNNANSCTVSNAQTSQVVGCKEKIVTFTDSNMKVIMYISIGAILLQAALVVVVMLAICL
ncbi:Tetraspanin-7 [Taenia crassiceps]|uniref:Tetraspanin n=1 Tax=Taenia crassiceps TaxID=6207 RepID=A0ABR4Q460_9CEST